MLLCGLNGFIELLIANCEYDLAWLFFFYLLLLTSFVTLFLSKWNGPFFQFCVQSVQKTCCFPWKWFLCMSTQLKSIHFLRNWDLLRFIFFCAIRQYSLRQICTHIFPSIFFFFFFCCKRKTKNYWMITAMYVTFLREKKMHFLANLWKLF